MSQIHNLEVSLVIISHPVGCEIGIGLRGKVISKLNMPNHEAKTILRGLRNRYGGLRLKAIPFIDGMIIPEQYTNLLQEVSAPIDEDGKRNPIPTFADPKPLYPNEESVVEEYNPQTFDPPPPPE